MNPGPQLSGYVSDSPSRPLFYPRYFLQLLQDVRRGAETARTPILPLFPIRTMLCLEIVSAPYGGYNACSVADNDSREYWDMAKEGWGCDFTR